MPKRRRQPTSYGQADEFVRTITGKTIVEHARELWGQFLKPELQRILARKGLEDPRYALLEVNARCSDAMLKAAWKQKTKETHPDAGGNAEKFKQITAAYESICRQRGIMP